MIPPGIGKILKVYGVDLLGVTLVVGVVLLFLLHLLALPRARAVMAP